MSAPTPLIVSAVRQALALAPETVAPEALAKARLCLADAVRCMFETRDLPPTRQARSVVRPQRPGVEVIGADFAAAPADAAFAMAVAAAGLLREDMHAASISHHGIIVMPTLLALAGEAQVDGRRFLAAAVVGYEMGARLGSALFDSDLARRLRPTTYSATAGAALAGAYLLGLSEDEAVAAVALAVDASSGLNQWARTGGSEIFFQAGRAAQAAVTAVSLARAGAFASPTLLDGEAGLFAAAGRPAPADLRLFDGPPEILAVYNKPLPICNFAQTASQAALDLARRPGFSAGAVRAVRIGVTEAAIRYPGCDFQGRYERPLQAKMSIRFGVGAALAHGDLDEQRFHALEDPQTLRLAGLATLESVQAFTDAFPARQGARVEIGMEGGATLVSVRENVVPATEAEIRAGLLHSGEAALGARGARVLAETLETLETAADAGAALRAATAAPALQPA